MARTVGEAFLMVLPNTSGFGAALILGTEEAATKAGAAASTAFAKAMSSLAVPGGAVLTVAVVGSLVAATNAAGDFEASMVKLVSTAGETGTMVSGNLKLVSNGILAMASSTGTTTKQLADGMYLVESAGFHGANALTVLQASAQGARAEQANLATVTNAVTSALKSYNLGSDSAVMITNQMVAAVGHGKTTFEEFSGSLSTVLPLASSLKISFAEVSGAVATMTNHGTSAAEATQQLAFTMRALVGPNKVAIAEMDRLGVSSVDVAQHIGERGLTGTLKLLSEAVLQHMGPSGLVMIDALNKSATAAEDARAMIAAMPPSLQKMAQGFLDGSVTLDKWKLGIKGLPADQAAMVKQFATLITHTTGFNDLLKKGGPAAQTYEDAIKKMTGGANGLMTTLMLTGGNLDSFQSNVAAVAEAGKHAGTNIEGWSAIQETFNFKVSQFKGTIEALGISIGQKVLPVLGSMVTGLNSMMNWLKGGSAGADLLVKSLGAVIAAIVTLTVVSKVATAVTALMSSALAVYRTIVFLVTNATELWTAIQLALDAAEMANPIGLIIIAIAALVAGVIYAYTHFKTFRDVVQAVWTAIKVATESVVNFFSKQVPEAWSFLYEHTIKIFQAVRNTIVGVWDGAIAKVDAVVAFFRALPGRIGAALLQLAVSIYQRGAEIVGWFQALPGRILAFVLSLPGKLAAAGKEMTDRLAYAIGFGIGLIIKEWLAFPGQVLGILQSLWTWAVQLTTAGVDAVVAWFKALPGRVAAEASALWLLVTTLFNSGVQLTVAHVSAMWTAVTGWFSRGVSNAVGFVTSLPGRVAALFTSTRDSAVNTASEMITSVINWFKQLPGRAAQELSSLAGTVKGAVASAGTWLWDAGKNILQGLVNGVKAGLGGAIGAVKDAMGSLLSGAKAALGIRSASTKFAEQVGKWIPAGVGVGVTQHAGLATASVAAMSSSLSLGKPGAAMSSSLALPAPAAPWAGAGAAATDRVVAMLEKILDAVDRVAPGVGTEINGSVGIMRAIGRGR